MAKQKQETPLSLQDNLIDLNKRITEATDSLTLLQDAVADFTRQRDLLQLEIQGAGAQLAQIMADKERLGEGIDMMRFLGVLFRTNYRREIAMGEHAGWTTKNLLSKYLERERYLHNHWWMRLGRVLRLV